MTTTAAPPAPASPRTDAVLTVFRNGTPQITTDPRFTRHRRTDHDIDFDAVLAEPGWSPGQRALIALAAALTGHKNPPPDRLSAHLTGHQMQLMLDMCQAARS